MKTLTRVGIVLLVVAVAGAIVYTKRMPNVAETAQPAQTATEVTATAAADEAAPQKSLPRLLDLGADKCVPCKMMKPILDELEKEYAGRMTVEFVDVWKNPDAATAHGIQAIPTQIFFAADGEEVTRHQGFLSKEDILKTWTDHGVELPAAAES